MAQIKFYKNMFEEDFAVREYDKNVPLIEQIKNFSTENVYTDFYIECYDAETGETSYEPLSDNAEELSVIIQVKGVVVSEDYEVKDGDEITVIYLPLGDDANLWQTIIGGVLAVAGGIMMAFPATAGLGAVLLSSGIGLLVGGIIGLATTPEESKAKTTLGGKQGSSSPDVRGAVNTSIVNSAYPFVIGKHLITPKIVGDPYTTYSGTRGEDAYIRVMYCLGYGPLYAKDFKLGDFVLAKNSNQVVSGKLRDIDPYWVNNNIELEIIQDAPNFNGASELYPSVVIQEEVNANILYIEDNSLSQISGGDVVYKGAAFANGYKTNTVVFTENCPKSFTVTLDAPNGLYASRNESVKKEVENEEGDKETQTVSESVYKPIPLYYLIQWRFYNENKDPSKTDGSDFYDWNNITTWNGVDCGEVLTDSSAEKDLATHEGNEYSAEIYSQYIGKTLCNFEKFSGENFISQTRLSATIDISKEDAKNIIKEGGPNTIKSIEIRVQRISPCYIDQKKTTNKTDDDKSNGPFSYSDIIKLNSISTVTFDELALKDNNEYKATPIQSDADFKKFSYVAIKAKADANGTLQSQLDSLSCTVQAFAPVWDSTEKKWLPEGVKRETVYYGYGEKLTSQPSDWSYNYDKYLLYNSGNKTFVKNTSSNFSQDLVYQPVDISTKALEVIVDKSMYEEIRQRGINWYSWQKGTNFASKMKAEIFSTFINGYYKLPQTAGKFLNNSSPSAFMLACVGPQNGPVALGYDEINLLSVTDWNDNCKGVTDGSKDNEDNLVEIDFCANGYVFERIKLEDLLKQVALTGRATYTYDETGKIKVIMDKPIDYPDGVINQQNCKEFSVNYNYEPLAAGLRISFNDENDGYALGSFFCWNDGNSEKNYKGQVEAYQIPFVTNPRQCWSLGRYFLAVSSFQKETVTAKLGVNSNLYSLGDVVAVQSDELLIGSNSARVQGVIEKNGYIYGIILDSTFEYYGETDSTGRCSQGVSIFQPKKYGKSRLITLRMALPDVSIEIDEQTYTMKKGISNVILFENGVPRDLSNDPSVSDYSKYDINSGEICLIGYCEVIYSRYRIVKVKPDNKNFITYTLVNYDDSFYNYGAKLPKFQKNMTTPRLKGKGYNLSDVPTTIKDWNEKVSNQIDATMNSTPTPPAPRLEKVEATRDGLVISFNKGEIAYYSSLTVEISKNVGTQFTRKFVIQEESLCSFDRDIDGYPEKEDFSTWIVRAKVTNTFGNTSPSWSNYCMITTTNYGTWQPDNIEKVSLSAHETELNFSWTTTSPYSGEKRTFYGNNVFDVILKYDEQERDIQEVTNKFSDYEFNRIIDGYPETDLNYEKYNETQPNATLLSKYTVEVRARDTISKKKSEYEMSNGINTDDYKTWYIETPKVEISASARAISLSMEKGNDNYGLNSFFIGVRKPNENIYFRPFTEYTDANGNLVTPYTSEENYKETRSEVSKYNFKSQPFGLYTQIMPLEGQNRYLDIWEKTKEVIDNKTVIYQKSFDSETSETKYQSITKQTEGGFTKVIKTEDISELEYTELDVEENNFQEETPTPKVTPYQFCVYVENEAHSGKTNYENTGLTALAEATGAKDITANSITNNKLADGCVTADKIHVGTITADQMAATDLSTAGVTVGKISGHGLNVEGDFSNQSNFWNLEDGNEEFRVGNDREFENADGTPKNPNAAYIHYKKDKTTGAGQLFIALSKFFVSSVASIIKGLFKIQSNDGVDFIKVNPEASSDTTETISAKTMQVKGNVEVSTKTTTNTLTITSGNDVDIDTFGNEPLSIGSASGFNIGIDSNEILARNNGKKSPLYLGGEFVWINDAGGDVYLGVSGSSKIHGDVMTTSYIDNNVYPVMGANQVYNSYVRVPKYGLLPYKNSLDGYGNLGTEDYPFKNVCSKTFNGDLNGAARRLSISLDGFSLTDDTVTYWGSQQACVRMISKKGIINNQPSTYGLLFSMGYGTDVFQIWHTQPSGKVYYRGGHINVGWDVSWVEIIDSNSITAQSVANADKIDGYHVSISGSTITFTKG